MLTAFIPAMEAVMMRVLLLITYRLVTIKNLACEFPVTIRLLLQDVDELAYFINDFLKISRQLL